MGELRGTTRAESQKERSLHSGGDSKKLLHTRGGDAVRKVSLEVHRDTGEMRVRLLAGSLAFLRSPPARPERRGCCREDPSRDRRFGTETPGAPSQSRDGSTTYYVVIAPPSRSEGGPVRLRRLALMTTAAAAMGMSWATKPTRASWPGVVPGCPPRTETDPASGRRSPTASWRSVVLPAPLGPTRPTTLPAGMASVHSESAHLCPYRLPRPLASKTTVTLRLLLRRIDGRRERGPRCSLRRDLRVGPSTTSA